MILIDIHIWIWWANGTPELRGDLRAAIDLARDEGIGVSAISCWEVALLARKGKLTLSVPAAEWIDSALRLPGVESIPLTDEIAVDSADLPGNFHPDPADRFIVATSRILDIPLLTRDGKILAYAYVRKV